MLKNEIDEYQNAIRNIVLETNKFNNIKKDSKKNLFGNFRKSSLENEFLDIHYSYGIKIFVFFCFSFLVFILLIAPRISFSLNNFDEEYFFYTYIGIRATSFVLIIPFALSFVCLFCYCCKARYFYFDIILGIVIIGHICLVGIGSNLQNTRSQYPSAVLITILTFSVIGLRKSVWYLMFVVPFSAYVISYLIFSQTQFIVSWSVVFLIDFLKVIIFLSIYERSVRRSFVNNRKGKLCQLKIEYQRVRKEELLNQILPFYFVKKIQTHPLKRFMQLRSNMCIILTDLVDFTNFCSSVNQWKLINLLDTMYSNFDKLCKEFGLEKIKTIGDAYFVCDYHQLGEKNAIRFCLAVQKTINKGFMDEESRVKINFSLRIGVASGMCCVGLIGMKSLTFDCWGPAVEKAMDLEGSSRPGYIQCCENVAKSIHSSYHLVKNPHTYGYFVIHREGGMNYQRDLRYEDGNPFPEADLTELLSTKSRMKPKKTEEENEIMEYNIVEDTLLEGDHKMDGSFKSEEEEEEEITYKDSEFTLSWMLIRNGLIFLNTAFQKAQNFEASSFYSESSASSTNSRNSSTKSQNSSKSGDFPRLTSSLRSRNESLSSNKTSLSSLMSMGKISLTPSESSSQWTDTSNVRTFTGSDRKMDSKLVNGRILWKINYCCCLFCGVFQNIGYLKRSYKKERLTINVLNFLSFVLYFALFSTLFINTSNTKDDILRMTYQPGMIVNALVVILSFLIFVLQSCCCCVYIDPIGAFLTLISGLVLPTISWMGYIALLDIGKDQAFAYFLHDFHIGSVVALWMCFLQLAYINIPIHLRVIVSLLSVIAHILIITLYREFYDGFFVFTIPIISWLVYVSYFLRINLTKMKQFRFHQNLKKKNEVLKKLTKEKTRILGYFLPKFVLTKLEVHAKNSVRREKERRIKEEKMRKRRRRRKIKLEKLRQLSGVRRIRSSERIHPIENQEEEEEEEEIDDNITVGDENSGTYGIANTTSMEDLLRDGEEDVEKVIKGKVKLEQTLMERKRGLFDKITKGTVVFAKVSGLDFRTSAKQLMIQLTFLNDLFSGFDEIMSDYFTSVKIKSITTSYVLFTTNQEIGHEASKQLENIRRRQRRRIRRRERRQKWYVKQKKFLKRVSGGKFSSSRKKKKKKKDRNKNELQNDMDMIFGMDDDGGTFGGGVSDEEEGPEKFFGEKNEMFEEAVSSEVIEQSYYDEDDNEHIEELKKRKRERRKSMGSYKDIERFSAPSRKFRKKNLRFLKKINSKELDITTTTPTKEMKDIWKHQHDHLTKNKKKKNGEKAEFGRAAHKTLRSRDLERKYKVEACCLSLDFMNLFKKMKPQYRGIPSNNTTITIGMCSGSFYAGLVGDSLKGVSTYDIFGDVVNRASRMSTSCRPGKIQAWRSFLEEDPELGHSFMFRLKRGVNVKGHGVVNTFYLSREIRKFTDLMNDDEEEDYSDDEDGDTSYNGDDEREEEEEDERGRRIRNNIMFDRSRFSEDDLETDDRDIIKIEQQQQIKEDDEEIEGEEEDDDDSVMIRNDSEVDNFVRFVVNENEEQNEENDKSEEEEEEEEEEENDLSLLEEEVNSHNNTIGEEEEEGEEEEGEGDDEKIRVDELTHSSESMSSGDDGDIIEE